MDIPQEKFEDFAAGARRMAGYGLMRCSSGNLSCRLDEQRMLVKASRSWMADLRAADVAVCRIADEVSLGGKSPSVEIGFHAGVLRTRADVNVVLHFQTTAATALACSRRLNEIDFAVIPEIAYYIGPIGVVPYNLPGSRGLAEAVVSAMKDHDLAMMANHGQIVVGNSFDDVIQKAVFFELACEIILRGGDDIRPLAPQAIAELRPQAVARRVRGV
jgi:ribulose-5-phosphate 4-epimerase/fuculose-1-phosphate aldolase